MGAKPQACVPKVTVGQAGLVLASSGQSTEDRAKIETSAEAQASRRSSRHNGPGALDQTG